MTTASFLSNISFNSAVVTRRDPSAGGGAAAGAGATGDVLALFHSAELQAVKTPRPKTAMARNERIRRIDKPPNKSYEQLLTSNK
jgi:hypothetical protein